MVIYSLLISILLEWAIYAVRPLWKVRAYVVSAPLMLTGFMTCAAIVYYPRWTIGFVIMVAAFRILNQLRIAQGRMHEQYLWHATRRTGLILGGLQVISIALLFVPTIQHSGLMLAYACLQLAFAAALYGITTRNIAKTAYRPGDTHYADRELPTVTVAIPARNETSDLEACLQTIIANDYPKLEILVLDDCSHDRTAEIIRSFAHAGVRFIKGAEPSERWLAKNQAYARLAQEATGELILFCGVDTRFGPQAIRALVTTQLSRNKDMLSVMPRRLTSEVMSVFVQPLRYWWELALPRKLFNRPPVLSTCWIIRRKRLHKLGGFDAVSHSILPEGYFARELVKADGYSFLRADDTLDVQTRKTPANQRHTAVRMRYPQIRRRPEIALLLTVMHVAFLLAPFGIALSALWAGFGLTQLAAIGAVLLLMATHVAIVQVSNPANVFVAGLSFPLAIIIELALSYASMYRYEFSTVDWKGRNVCLPVMHAIPHLPPLTDK
jgi:chlorobactene glucosyltransferase